MDAALLHMILIAAVMVVATAAIAKWLRVGSAFDQRTRADGLNVGSSSGCCVSGLGKLAADLRESRDSPHR